MEQTKDNDRGILAVIARKAMLAGKLQPNFSLDALAELEKIKGPATAHAGLRDMRHYLWSTIDNDDSLDLDQATAAQLLDHKESRRNGGWVRILVAIADVDSLVPKDSLLDRHARENTSSIYTPAIIFPMLPPKLSTDLTSLNEGQDRISLIVDITFDRTGEMVASDFYRGLVRNLAKLSYNGVATWLERRKPAPHLVTRVLGMEENIRLQDQVAQRLAMRRKESGALNLETLATKAIFTGNEISNLAPESSNRATSLIEEFMLAANRAVAAYLTSRGFPSVRRVLRSPERWDRIRQLAAEFAHELPIQPDGRALEAFLSLRQAAAPLAFADLSLAVVKLIGRGEYAIEIPGQGGQGHFGLAVREYAHSTAPNRRYVDLITHRLVKAAMQNKPIPYTTAELASIAEHCTRQEEVASKLERKARKSSEALFIANRVKEYFDGVITGVSEMGTYVRILNPPMEGQIICGYQGVTLGEKVRVQLIRTNVERGFIDFGRQLTPPVRPCKDARRNNLRRRRPQPARRQSRGASRQNSLKNSAEGSMGR